MIERKDVEHVARLARLALSAAEIEKMREQLNGILAYIEKLNALATDDVEPTSHAVPMVNVMRDDAPGPCLPRDEALANAPDRAGEFFRVPRIIED
ncbi:MAG: Asp-tRNA(Asn)/Glu-tRNA(Gln) amidotransferase subunit GatC [Candidatus Rokubacteria bacterium]|nr:Asp-tRNA(Asn)/Glu-tRNA(Gln) amidotransferase subunit GatC [Candidatus Rokubacteria bacterium]